MSQEWKPGWILIVAIGRESSLLWNSSGCQPFGLLDNKGPGRREGEGELIIKRRASEDSRRMLWRAQSFQRGTAHLELYLRTVTAERLYPVIRDIPESASYKRLHFRGPQGKCRSSYIVGPQVLRSSTPPLSLTWMLMRTSELVSCCHIAPVHTPFQFNDLLNSVYDRLVSAWLFPWFPSHWKWIPSPCHCMQGVIFTCLHTHSFPNPSSPPHWPQMSQSGSFPRTFARAVSFAYKALQTLSLSPPGLYLNPFGSERLPGYPI